LSRIFITRPLPDVVLNAARSLFDVVEVRQNTLPLI